MKTISLKNSGIIWLVLSAVVIVCDQFSKYIAIKHLIYGEPHRVFSLLNFDLSYNPGAAFSFLGQASGWQVALLSGVAIIVIMVLTIWLAITPRAERLLSAGISLIIGGAAGNLIDRVYHAYVIDFLQFHYRSWYFATFNVADAAITIGACCIILHMFWPRKST